MAKTKTVEVNGRAWTKSDVKELLKTNDKAVLRGLLVIYDNQTETEKAIGGTYVDNGIGFNGVDAEILSSFAEQIKKRGFLSPKQMDIARKKILKYAGQLFKHMELKTA